MESTSMSRPELQIAEMTNTHHIQSHTEPAMSLKVRIPWLQSLNGHQCEACGRRLMSNSRSCLAENGCGEGVEMKMKSELEAVAGQLAPVTPRIIFEVLVYFARFFRFQSMGKTR